MDVTNMDVTGPALWADWSVIVTLVGTLTIGLWRIAKKVERVASVDKRLEKEFGGNSGGIRQAVNELRVNMDTRFDHTAAEISAIKQSVAHLQGRFEQHVDEQ